MFWTLPNALSALRIALAPVLLVLAWSLHERWFLAGLIVSLLSDILDGKLARWLDQCSEWGARLDSWGDLATYLTVPICAYWLKPGFLRQEAFFFWLVVGAYVLPVAYGFAKFRSLTSYHTRGAVVSAYLVGAATILIFAGGPAWFFRLAALVLALAELEEMAITTVLPRPVTNVKDLRAALRLAREPLDLRA
jgi:phosphatidylglycerophosphate synthase